MKADELRRIINQNPDLIRFKRQLVGCCRRKAPDATIISRVKGFVKYYPQFKEILNPILET